MSDNPNVSGRYRELPREEPPRALDDAILAASRRAVDARPAPLVVPSGRRRWYYPVAAAAIIVLAVAVTVHVERQQPAEEVVVQVEPAKEVLPSEAPPQVAQAPAPAKKAFQSAPEPEPAAPPAPQPEARERQERSGPAMDALAKRADEANAQLQRAEGARARSAAPASVAAAAALSSLSRGTPEQWLMGIDDLKRQRRHEEAERELAEFRKRYPTYRIPEAITEKFETR